MTVTEWIVGVPSKSETDDNDWVSKDVALA